MVQAKKIRAAVAHFLAPFCGVHVRLYMLNMHKSGSIKYQKQPKTFSVNFGI